MVVSAVVSVDEANVNSVDALDTVVVDAVDFNPAA